MRTFKLLGAMSIAAAALSLGSPALAQVQPDPDYPRAEDLQVDTHAAYRVRSIRIDPLDLSGTEAAQAQWTEQRLRLDGRIWVPTVGGIVVQADVLDGVLLGDNGRFGGDPSSFSGVSLAAKKPNNTTWRVGLPEGADPLDADSYVPVLAGVDVIDLNYVYGDIILPIGLLRIGRQPVRTGAGITAHDGGRRNRWGVSQYSDAVDRVLFGTKLDQAYYLLTRKDHILDAGLDDGVILGLIYDFQKQDDPTLLSDDLRQMGVAVEWRKRRADWLGFDWRNFLLAGNVVYLTNEEFDTDVFGFPVNFEAVLGERLALQLQYMHIRGKTREIAEGFSALSSQDPVRQDVVAHGLQFVADANFDPVVLTMEVDYATGDGDPRSTTPVTSFSFARDLNVGLLLFEHILAFESARSVAVGVENLANLDVESFPLTEARTDGRFTNAIAVFPQIYVDLARTPKHRFFTRAGVLMAWAEATEGVVDPIATTLAADGEEIVDDVENYHGGRPGVFYGTEVDAQIGWRFKEHFEWIMEGAVLFPGAGLEDENGDAINAYMLENRFVLLY